MSVRWLIWAFVVGAGCAAPELPDAAGECGSAGEPCCPTVVSEDEPCNHGAVCVEDTCERSDGGE